jgi:hypothetical protein
LTIVCEIVNFGAEDQEQGRICRKIMLMCFVAGIEGRKARTPWRTIRAEAGTEFGAAQQEIFDRECGSKTRLA